MKRCFLTYVILFFTCLSFLYVSHVAHAGYRFSDFTAYPPIHVFGAPQVSPVGLAPAALKTAYHLPQGGGEGTVAIIGAYTAPLIEQDLAVFSRQFGLPECTIKNGCLEKHVMSGKKGTGSATAKDSRWALETSLDVEWVHAIAPNAKILLVSAVTPSGQNLLDAVDYARERTDVVAVSMSWGGPEFVGETDLDTHFTTPIARAQNSITFFASSGDTGTGASWPAASPYVVAVGGTHLSFASNGSLDAETAWSGSGGGVSAYEKQPNYQKQYKIARAGDMRAIPDVSYNADPQSGVSVYYSGSTQGGPKAHGGAKNWFVLGGTSAGAPQWAGIKALGLSADNSKFYSDKASSHSGDFFRDIKTGVNGNCGYICTARKNYDYVTGLGSPLTVKF